MIRLGFLFQMSTIFSRSSFESFSGDSMEIFIKWERLTSPRRFLNRVLIIFILEKLRSTDAVPTGIERHTLARILRFGNIAMSMLLVVSSFSSFLVFSLGCVMMYLW